MASTEDTSVDLGHGVVIDMWLVDAAGHRIGLMEKHPWGGKGFNETGLCAGSIWFDTPEAHAEMERVGATGAYWQVHSWEPLTVSPSLLCSCGHHGFIREGKWVPA